MALIACNNNTIEVHYPINDLSCSRKNTYAGVCSKQNILSKPFYINRCKITRDE